VQPAPIPNRAWWKQLIDVQWPYRRHVRRLQLGFVLDVACGYGRNLFHLEGNGVGIDIDRDGLAFCKSQGLTVFTPDEFKQSSYATDAQFDSLLFSHVLEHMKHDEAVALVSEYLPRVKPGGKVVFITPQEAGFKINDTHVELVDFAGLTSVTKATGLTPVEQYSFPFPRVFGKVFRYNEFVAITKKPS
jgi:SAM-dependent methyltransferase